MSDKEEEVRQPSDRHTLEDWPLPPAVSRVEFGDIPPNRLVLPLHVQLSQATLAIPEGAQLFVQVAEDEAFVQGVQDFRVTAGFELTLTYVLRNLPPPSILFVRTVFANGRGSIIAGKVVSGPH